MRPQWKASIDFKWIRDNKEAVEINIKNRNSNADLGAVIELYENMVNLQKVIFNFLSLLPIKLNSKLGTLVMETCKVCCFQEEELLKLVSLLVCSFLDSLLIECFVSLLVSG